MIPAELTKQNIQRLEENLNLISGHQSLCVNENTDDICAARRHVANADLRQMNSRESGRGRQILQKVWFNF